MNRFVDVTVLLQPIILRLRHTIGDKIQKRASMDPSKLVVNHIPYVLKFDPSIDLIEEKLFLGDLSAATNKDTLNSFGITHILTIDIQPLPASITQDRNYSCAYICAVDREEADLLSHFDDAVKFLTEAEQRGKAFVHCYFGVSRSAAIMCAYLMYKYHLTVDEAIERVRLKRRIISPNVGFIAQLHLFLKMNYTLDDKNLQYKLYTLHHVITKLQIDKNYGAALAACAPDDFSSSDTETVYKCKRCRHILFSEKSVFPHYAGKSVHWSLPLLHNLPQCKEAYLIQPFQWMAEPKLASAGKLTCQTCKAKFGSFDWMGSKCACGARMEPNFFVPKDRVDEVPPGGKLPIQTSPRTSEEENG